MNLMPVRATLIAIFLTATAVARAASQPPPPPLSVIVYVEERSSAGGAPAAAGELGQALSAGGCRVARVYSGRPGPKPLRPAVPWALGLARQANTDAALCGEASYRRASRPGARPITCRAALTVHAILSDTGDVAWSADAEGMAAGDSEAAAARSALAQATRKLAPRVGQAVPALALPTHRLLQVEAATSDVAAVEAALTPIPGVRQVVRRSRVGSTWTLGVDADSAAADGLAAQLGKSERLRSLGLKVARSDRWRLILAAAPAERAIPEARAAVTPPDRLVNVSVVASIPGGDGVAAARQASGLAARQAVAEAVRPYLLPGTADAALAPILARSAEFAQVEETTDLQVEGGELRLKATVHLRAPELVKALAEAGLARRWGILVYVAATNRALAEAAAVEHAAARGLLAAGQRPFLVRLTPSLPLDSLAKLASAEGGAVLQAAAARSGADLALLMDVDIVEGASGTSRLDQVLDAHALSAVLRARLLLVRSGEVVRVTDERTAALWPRGGSAPSELADAVRSLAAEMALEAASLDAARVAATGP